MCGRFHSMESQKHKHELEIKIFRKQAGLCQSPEVIPVTAKTPLGLVGTQPDLLNGIHFFNLRSWRTAQSTITTLGTSPTLRGRSGYGQLLTPKQGVCNPTLTVPHGLFYTLRSTGSTFRRQKPEGDGVLEVGSLAGYVGVNIYLKPGGSVELNIGGTVKVLEQATNVKHEIHFVNHCKENNPSHNHCEDKFKPYHLTDKTPGK